MVKTEEKRGRGELCGKLRRVPCDASEGVVCPDEETFIFDSVEGSTDTLIEALAELVGVSGVNITLVFSENRLEETLALLVLLDDLDNGSTTIVSFGEEVGEN